MGTTVYLRIERFSILGSISPFFSIATEEGVLRGSYILIPHENELAWTERRLHLKYV